MRQVVDMEFSAATTWHHNSVVIPGLLQTEAHMRYLFRAYCPSWPADEIERGVKRRLGRQAALDNMDQHFWFVIHEAALRFAGEHRRRQLLAARSNPGADGGDRPAQRRAAGGAVPHAGITNGCTLLGRSILGPSVPTGAVRSRTARTEGNAHELVQVQLQPRQHELRLCGDRQDTAVTAVRDSKNPEGGKLTLRTEPEVPDRRPGCGDGGSGSRAW